MFWRVRNAKLIGTCVYLFTSLQLEPQKCPFEGVFALSNLAKGSLIRSNGLSIGLCAQSQLRVNCNEDTHKLELQARCSFQDESLGFNCNGGWRDDKNHYLLLTSEDGTNKYCLTYQGANQLSKYEHNRQYLSQDHLFVSLNGISCHRSVHHSSKFAYFGQNLATNHYRHSHGSINFELIRQSSCYSSMEISSSTSIQNDLNEKLLKLIFTVIFTWFIVVG